MKSYCVPGIVQCGLYIIFYSHKNVQRLMLLTVFYSGEKFKFSVVSWQVPPDFGWPRHLSSLVDADGPWRSEAHCATRAF